MTREEQETSKAIIEWGVISWYNYGGRLGMWYDFMDGINTIQHLIEVAKKENNYDLSLQMMVAYTELEGYMKKEKLWEKGVVPQ
jgi:hypothetical protein